jgi:hypothetical protein
MRIIRSVGPLLYLASQAATKDGQLDFVCAREEDRSLLIQYLDARLAGQRVKFPLPLRRFRKLNIVCENATLHFDSKVWPRKKQKAKSASTIEITVRPSALRDPTTGRRSAKIGVIAGQTRSPRAVANSNRGVGLKRDIPGEKRYRNVTPARE